MNGPAIAVEGLRFTYPGAVAPAVRDISFTVEPGEIFGFLGPSGAGKSTTQKILIRLLGRYAGRVAVLGRDLTKWQSDLYERIGVSFELPNHYQKLSALENLRLFAALHEGPTEEPLALLERMGLAEDAHTRVAAFSKGMQMRLNLARALLHYPDLLFLDEPTAGLDPANARRVKEIALEIKRQGRTIFLTTHDMHVAEDLCDRVAFMVDGALVRIDSPRTLKIAEGVRRLRVEYRENGVPAHCEFPLDGLAANVEFLTILRSHPIETMHTQEATLEEIFIRVTGRALA